MTATVETARALDAARAALTSLESLFQDALRAVDVRKLELAEAAKGLARAPSDPQAVKDARASRTVLADSEAVVAGLAELTVAARVRLSEAQRAHAAALEADGAAERERDLDEAAALLRGKLDIEAASRELGQKIAAIVGKHAGDGWSAESRSRAEDLSNEVRRRAGVPGIDWRGNPIVKAA